MSRNFKYVNFEFLFQTDNEDVVQFLVSTKIIPLLLRIMETGSELPRTVATFILQRILMDEGGLSYVCRTFDRYKCCKFFSNEFIPINFYSVCRFSHVAMILGKLILMLTAQPSTRLLKHVVLCYLRLSDNHQ